MFKAFLNFFFEEFFFFLFLSGSIFLILLTGEKPFITLDELKVLVLLLSLLAVLKTFELSGFPTYAALKLRNLRFAPFLLVFYTFFLSTFATNDVALLSVVPITLKLRKPIVPILAVLETLAANIGSAISPIGNPQNIYLFHYYQLNFWDFEKTILPFGFALGLLLFSLSLLLTFKPAEIKGETPKVDFKIFVLSLISLSIYLTVFFNYLPLPVLVFTFLPLLLIDWKEIIHLDYMLIATFAVFFLFSNLLSSVLNFQLTDDKKVFWTSLLVSQVISNVPAAVLVSKFTTLWKPLLWGVNVGGFGSPVGSLANLITIRFLAKERKNFGIFITLFAVFNLLFLFEGIFLYFFLF